MFNLKNLSRNLKINRDLTEYAVPTDCIALAVYAVFVRFFLSFKIVEVPTFLDFRSALNSFC
ncbi:hypothetical protein DPV73_16660 [Leptospira mayottensis]|nr:hypothetical protein DPV73_16660 [Leptospira mayottensis]